MHEKIDYNSFNKELAYNWLKSVYTNPNCAVNYFLGDKDFHHDKNDYHTLLYSYSDPSEIQQIANNSILNQKKYDGVTVNFDVIQKDHYAIIYDSSRNSCDFGGCFIGITFDKQYVNYYNEEKIENGAHISNDYLHITNLDKDWVKTAMDIISEENYSYAVYDSNIEQDGDNYIYTTIHIAVSFDYDRYDEFLENHIAPYAIYLTEEKTIINSNGEPSKDNEVLNNGIIKTFPLTQEESDKLVEMMQTKN